MTLCLDIRATSALWRTLPRARALARATITACIAESNFADWARIDVSLCLTDDDEVQALNARWRGIDKPTNVLSFPSSLVDQFGETRMVGDIALAYETVAREAQEEGASLADHYCHLVAHGFLHLIGYDHQTDEEAGRMEGLERRVLAKLGIGDPYADEMSEI
jgi:probable rRNA maturation factor